MAILAKHHAPGKMPGGVASRRGFENHLRITQRLAVKPGPGYPGCHALTIFVGIAEKQHLVIFKLRMQQYIQQAALAGNYQLGHTSNRLLVQLPDRKSTRLNSSHVRISYAVFCLKKKKKK